MAKTKPGGELSDRRRQSADSILWLCTRTRSVSGTYPISVKNENNCVAVDKARSLIFDRNAEWRHSSMPNDNAETHTLKVTP